MFSENVHVVTHPLVSHKLTILRDKDTATKDFRELVSEIGMLLTYEATRDLPLVDKEVETPICKTMAPVLKGKKFAVVPILRAGLGLVDGVLRMVPSARVGHIGLYRNEDTLEPVKYFCTSIKLMVLLAAPEGIERVQHDHPDVDIYCGAVDDRLNENGYIVPGLGDAGDRIFGTK